MDTHAVAARSDKKKDSREHIRPTNRAFFKKERDLKPHRHKIWLNPNIKDIAEFQKTVENICNTYQSAEVLAQNGVHVYSVDEKTGIQATEHAHPKRTMKPGQTERIDPEYIRHGTTAIIATRSVTTGEIINPMIQPTRTEDDFVSHIGSLISLNPNDKHIFIVDNLNTHKSEGLVRLIAQKEKIDEESLGKKRKNGILENMQTREEFLKDISHNNRFIYTPKHCSWLNQIECWFSIITRRLLNRRSSFTSVQDLEQKIKGFIDYYNKYLKKPFKWNFKGKLLRV